MDAFDYAFSKCSKEEQDAILRMTPEEFAKELARSFGLGDQGDCRD